MNGDNIADQSTLTDRNGDYAFTNLPWSATGHSVWQASSPASAETVTRYDGIVVNVTTHLATYNFSGQQQARILVTSDGTNGLILPALEGQLVYLSASINPNLIGPHYQWTVVGKQGAPLSFVDPGDSATATFTPLNQGDFLVIGGFVGTGSCNPLFLYYHNASHRTQCGTDTHFRHSAYNMDKG